MQESDDNAHQPSIAVIHNFLHGILKLFLAGFVDGGHLMIHPVHYQIFHGFSKDTGSPDPLSFVCFLFQILDQILGLLLISNDRSDLGLDVGADQMDGRRFCMDLYSVF